MRPDTDPLRLRFRLVWAELVEVPSRSGLGSVLPKVVDRPRATFIADIEPRRPIEAAVLAKDLEVEAEIDRCESLALALDTDPLRLKLGRVVSAELVVLVLEDDAARTWTPLDFVGLLVVVPAKSRAGIDFRRDRERGVEVGAAVEGRRGWVVCGGGAFDSWASWMRSLGDWEKS